jgi:LysR family transcriptional regulator, benzoate and cis,cis-muconate-responsive activator of ben and cat genes
MPGQSLEIKHVQSFIAVANLLSFSRAALKLHLSQPALSAQIKALEADLGVLLLERNRRTVKLTPAGELLLHDAELLLQQITGIERRVVRMAAGEIGHLRIGFVASATLELVPAIALAFRKQYPRVSLELKNMPTVQQLEALRAGAIDAGFVRMPLTAQDLSVDLVHREPFAIVLSKSHPLARKKDLSVRDLAQEPFIAYGRKWAPAYYDNWTEICRRAGFTPTVIQETAEMATALALVAAGLGVAILPQGITNRSRRVLKIKVLNREKIHSEIGLAIPHANRTPLLGHLFATAMAFVKQ